MLLSGIKATFERVVQSRILRNSSAMMVSNVASTGTLFLLSIFLARRLGATDYGLMVLAMAIVKGVTRFLDIQSDDAIIKFMGEATAKDRKQEAISFFYAGFIADAVIMVATVAILLAVMPIISAVYRNDLLLILVKIYILSLPLSLLDNIFSTLLIVFKRYYLLAVLTIVNNVIQVVCVLAFTLSGTVETAMWGYVLASAIVFFEQVGLGIVVLRLNLGTFRGRDFKAAWRQLLPFVFHTNLAGYLKYAASNADILLLGAFRPAAEVSFYKIARSASQLMVIPTGPVSTVIYPALNEAWAQDNWKRARKLVWQYIAYTAAITVVATVGIFILADPAVRLIYGPEFSSVGNLMRILGITIVFGQIGAIGQPVMFARGRPAYNTLQKLESALLRLATYLLLIPILGATGAAIASLISVVIVTIILLVFIFPALGIWEAPWTNRASVNQAQLK